MFGLLIQDERTARSCQAAREREGERGRDTLDLMCKYDSCHTAFHISQLQLLHRCEWPYQQKECSRACTGLVPRSPFVSEGVR